jgi:transketolase
LKFYGEDMSTLAPLGYDDLPALLMRLTGDEKHDWSSLSTLDAIWVLFDRVLGDHDRFLLSKGHGPAAYYAVLAARGLLPVELLESFGSFDSPLGNHPDRVLVPGVDLSSGSLGHGLPIAAGVALAGRRVYCLVGDAELEEGSNWEAVQFAGREGLDPLTAIVIDNRSSTRGWPGGIGSRFAAEGWTASVAGGHDHDALERAFTAGAPGRPHVAVVEVSR